MNPGTQRVTIVSGQTATVNFNNKLKRGSLEVTKTSEDGLVDGHDLPSVWHIPLRAAGGRICCDGWKRCGAF